MKKVIILGAALLLAAAVCAAALFPGAPEEIAPLEPREGTDFACAELTYDEGLRLLSGTQTLILHNRSGEALSEIVLRLPMNAVDGASCRVSGVHANGERVSFSQDEDDPTVLTVTHPWAEGERVELSFSLMVKHPAQAGVHAVTLPHVAMREGGAWRTDAYDGLAGVSYVHAFDLSVTVDGVCAAAMRGARDVSFVIPQGCAVRDEEVSGVRIRAVAAGEGAARTLLSAAEEALKSLILDLG